MLSIGLLQTRNIHCEKIKRTLIAQSSFYLLLAERQGFEPWYPVEGNTISSRAPSTTRPSLRILLTTCISYHKKLDLSSIIFKKIQLFVKNV